MGPLWLVPILPLAAMLLILLLPRQSVRYAGTMAAAAAGASSLLAIAHLRVAAGGVILSISTRFSFAGRSVEIGLSTDPLSAVMAALVAVIATLVLIYSIAYMADDRDPRRFFAVMSLFTGAMLALVLASDYLLLYLSWEIVGLCSYLLIGHYWHEQKTSPAAIKAFLVTRIGDVSLLLAVALMLIAVGSVRFEAVFQAIRSGTVGQPLVTGIAVLMLLGALGKSAQFPLHWWLPDAMVGPTPVSALIHSATMVAAGVYLLARSFPLFSAAPAARSLLLIAALATAFGAALAAAVQTDVKRLLAYSTMSQLGEMGLVLAFGAPVGAVFHLIAHATFKSLLFLAAGVATQAVGGNELSRLPGSNLARWGFLAGALSLSGIPPFAGFWSRESIAAAMPPTMHWVLVILASLSAFYIARAFLLGFTGRAEDAGTGALFSIPVYGLAGITLIAGVIAWSLLPQLLGAPQPRLGWSSAIDVLVAVLGWAAAAVIYRWGILDFRRVANRLQPVRAVMKGGFGTEVVPANIGVLATALFQRLSAFETNVIDAMSRQTARAILRCGRGSALVETGIFDRFSSAVANSSLRLAGRTDWLDVRVLDRSVLGSASALRDLGGRVRAFQTGRIYHYLAIVFLWIVVAGAITFALRW